MNFEVLNNAPVAVTGADGFVGRYVLSRLVQSGWSPEKIIQFNRSHANDLVGFGQERILDITNFAQVENAIKETAPSAVIHLAAVANPRDAQDEVEATWRTNFDATRNLASSIMRYSPKTRLIFAGSSEGYGLAFNNSRTPIVETAPLMPMSVYGATKAAADIALGQMYLAGLDVVRFRAFNHTGPGQTPAYVVPAFAEQVARIERSATERVIRVGDLTAIRDFLDVRDVAKAYVSALSIDSTATGGSALNLCSGVGTSIQTVLDILLEEARVDISVVVDPERERPSQVLSAIGDNTPIKNTCSWRPEIDFRDTIIEVLDFFREKGHE